MIIKRKSVENTTYYSIKNENGIIGRFAITVNNDNYYLFNVSVRKSESNGDRFIEEIITKFNNLPIIIDIPEDNVTVRTILEAKNFSNTYFWSDENDIVYIEMIREVK